MIDRYQEEFKASQAKHDDEFKASQAKSDVLHQELCAKLDALIAEKQQLHVDIAKRDSMLNDQPGSIADVQELIHLVMDKGLAMKPRNKSDCEQWLYLCDEVIRSCLGNRHSPGFVYPNNYLDDPKKAKDALNDCVSSMNQRYRQFTQAMVISGCTKSMIKELREKIESFSI